ncbi:bifunctional epoxide hydrolase 2-like, partial [Trifolium medium]|nr:bifunctional epoxide hydrolase 2-like [Trifolium medium]
GDTDAPSSASSYTPLHIVGDLVGLLDALAVDRVFLVGHDWGAAMAWNPSRKPVQTMRAMMGDDYYMCRFQ